MEKNIVSLPSPEAIHKIKDADKDVSIAFFFKNGEILVEDEDEKEGKSKNTIEAFEKINNRS